MHSIDLPTIVTALLALIILIDVSVLWLTGRQVPELLMQLLSAVVGFYFGRTPTGRPGPRAAAKKGQEA